MIKKLQVLRECVRKLPASTIKLYSWVCDCMVIYFLGSLQSKILRYNRRLYSDNDNFVFQLDWIVANHWSLVLRSCLPKI